MVTGGDRPAPFLYYSTALIAKRVFVADKDNETIARSKGVSDGCDAECVMAVVKGMNKKTIRDIDVKGKRVLVRVDFNVPLKDGKVDDDARIRAALPTLEYVLEQGGALVLMSHLGRPDGQVKTEFSLKTVAVRLSELLDQPVTFADDCLGEETRSKAQALQAGEVLLLENLRFHAEEEGKPALPKTASEDEKKQAKAAMKPKQEAFARELATLGDVLCNDAFGTAHRAHASTAIANRFFDQSVAGFLMEKELEYLGGAIENPEHPFIAIIGGAKISGKIDVLAALTEKVDTLIIGGGMAYTFYLAKGLPVGNSLVEPDNVDLAKEVLRKAKERDVDLLLPVDHIIADKFSESAKVRQVGEKDIPDGWMALDIGPETIRLFAKTIAKARTVVWNGPMGCFEMEPFAEGTMAVTRTVADTDCVSIIGGGDSVSAVNRSGLAGKITHISTGGGASLEFLEGKKLPGVEALSDR